MNAPTASLLIALAIASVAGCGQQQGAANGTEPEPTPTEVAQPATEVPPAAKESQNRIEIAVVEEGFEPTEVTVRQGEPMALVFTRKTENTCAKQVIVDLGDGTKVKKDLPLNQPVTIVATFREAGELGYSCGMNMETGIIEVQ